MLADRNGLALIADAAHAIGARDGEYATGSMGDAEVVSIGATKQVAAGEGGAVTVRDPDKVSGMRRFKLPRSASRRDGRPGSGDEPAPRGAHRGARPSPARRPQRATRASSSKIHERYATAVADLPLRLSGTRSGTTSAHKDQLVWPDDPADRARLRRALAEAGIETKRYYEVAIPDLTAFWVGSNRRTAAARSPRARSRSDSRATGGRRRRAGHHGHRRLLPELVAVTVRLGLARRDPDPHTESLLEAIALAAESINVRPAWLRRTEDQAEFDLVLAVGTPRYYPWLLDSPPASTRISWFGEPLPRGSKATARFGYRPGLGRSGGISRSLLRATRRVAGPLKWTPLPGQLGAWREAAAIEQERVDNLAMTARCSSRGTRIVVTSFDRGAALAAAGIPASVVPFGYHARHAGPLTPPDSARDIEVVIIGSGMTSTRRRRGRILSALRPGLGRLGLVVEIDGRWGDERDAILRRSRVVLDIQRVPGDFTGLRWLLASAAGAAYVVEPIDDPSPFRVGVDHVEAPVESLIDEVAQLLDDEPRRRSIAEAAQHLLRGELAMHRSLERVLAG